MPRSFAIVRNEPDVPGDVLDLVVNKLMQITRETGLDYAIRVGSLVIHYFYGGNVATWRQRGPKTASFRRLAMHPALPMSASVLCRCVAAYDLCLRLDVVSRWSRITMSHIRIVLRLAEADQLRLLATANSEKWTVQRLEEETRKHTTRSAGRRPRAPRLRGADAIARVLRGASLVMDTLPELGRVLGDDLTAVQDALAASMRSLQRARSLLIAGPGGVEKRDRDGGTSTALPFEMECGTAAADALD